MHQLKKVLATEARKELRKNLPDTAAIIYSDFSKGNISALLKVAQTECVKAIGPSGVRALADVVATKLGIILLFLSFFFV